MDAVTFIRDYMRICKSHSSCGDCPLLGGCMGSADVKDTWMNDMHQIINAVDEWSKSHPIKTRLADICEKYPNLRMNPNDTPKACAESLGYTNTCIGDCMKCWDIPLEE